MAKKSVIHRNEKRVRLVDAKRSLRDELKSAIINLELTPDERFSAMIKLQKMPRDTSPSRRRNRCKLCGRPRAYNRLTGMCRLHMRLNTIFGMVPGMHKASW